MPTEARAEFPAEPASASSARRFVVTTLRRWQCDALADVATLLVSELVANAVLHAGTAIAVALKLQGVRLRVEVSDGSATTPTRKHYSNLATTGRGLMLVERLSSGWGVMPVPGGGKRVWFELEPGAPAGDAGLGVFDFGLDDLEDAPLPTRGPEAARPVGGNPTSPGDDAPPRLRVLVLTGLR